MKSNLNLLIILFFSCMVLQSCEREVPEPAPLVQGLTTNGGGGGGGGGATTGDFLFWSNFSGAPITVTLDGAYIGTITSYYSTAPSCGTSGCVTVTKPAGTYTVTGTDGTTQWSGTATISLGVCTRVLF